MALVVIYNCKRCKVGRRVEYPVKVPSMTQRSGHWWARDDGSAWISPGVWIQSSGGGKSTVYGGDPLGVCPTCGHAMAYGALVAMTVDAIPCDARCTGARGHSCQCSCGGKNHGRDWT